MTFTEYLQEQHMIDNPELLDDDLPDDFDRWLGTMDIDELIQYADDFSKHVQKEILRNIIETFKPKI